MFNKKYEILTDETIKYEGRTLYRIVALKDFDDVEAGELGGWVQSEFNLSQLGNCWIYDEAKAMDNSRVCGNAEMRDNARMYDNSAMHGNSQMRDNAEMHGNSVMFDNAKMFDNSCMHGYSTMYGWSYMGGSSEMYDAELRGGYLINNTVLTNKQILCGNLYSTPDDYLEIQNPKGRLVTCILKDNQILYNIGCQREITKERFINRIHNEDGGLEKNPHRRYYLKIIELSEMYFK